MRLAPDRVVLLHSPAASGRPAARPLALTAKRIATVAALLGTSWAAFASPGPESRCFGQVADGRLESGTALPLGGSNFSAYSALAVTMGRTYVHSTVADIVTDAYAAIAAAHPEYVYVYGETGLPGGGPFPPHRTHQNGLSVDFFVPVRDGQGQPATLPTSPGNRFGYDIEFDRQGRYGEYAIDFPAMAEHLYQLHRAAEAHGAGIALVIFERTYLPALFATPRGAWLQRNLPFMQRDPWVRHDEHYHVDFALPCAPLKHGTGR